MGETPVGDKIYPHIHPLSPSDVNKVNRIQMDINSLKMADLLGIFGVFRIVLDGVLVEATGIEPATS